MRLEHFCGFVALYKSTLLLLTICNGCSYICSCLTDAERVRGGSILKYGLVVSILNHLYMLLIKPCNVHSTKNFCLF